MRARVRVGLVLAVIVVTACDAESMLDASLPDAGVEADAGEARVCGPGETATCDCGGALGVRVCVERGIGFGACACPDGAIVEADAGLVGDDAGAPAADAGRDSGLERDAGSDAGALGPCELFPQSGCPAGYACRRETGVGRFCAPAGDDDEGDDCESYDAGGDSCAPGLYCSAICFRYCRVGSGDEWCPSLGGTARTCDDFGGICVDA